ncbi:MAG: carboxypeptidase regulatory-like domain-containing protein [Pyrinomonadaceae bacterium]
MLSKNFHKGISNNKFTPTALFTIFALLLFGASATQATVLPTLRGEQAVEQLKESGQYNSLAEAVKAARKAKGETAEGNAPDPVGQSAKLTAADGAINDDFGWSVAVSDDTAIVGAYGDDVGANANQGSAYVFVHSGTTWIQQAHLIASDGVPNDLFGWSVAVSGDTAIIGTRLGDVGSNTNQGAAYVFFHSGANWTQQSQFIATNGAANDNYGTSVAVFGDTAIVGAPGHTVVLNASQGAVYVFVRSGTTWTQQSRLIAADGSAGDQFGKSVAISGNTVVVGALYYSYDGSKTNQGAAYVFFHSGTNWTQQAQLIAADSAAGDHFGSSVAISGNTAIVGVTSKNGGANAGRGVAYVFVRSDMTWTQQQELTASGGAAGDQFGGSVAISGDKISVGAAFFDPSASSHFADGNSAPTATNQGIAFMFINQPLAPTAAAAKVSGRVISVRGRGVANATVILTDAQGETRQARTNPFGFYSFGDVPSGETYIFSVSAKRYRFAPQVVFINEDTENLNFPALW